VLLSFIHTKLKIHYGSSKTADDYRAFGDYQYFFSFGGDQYFDLPASIDSNYGVSGQITQVSNAFFTIPTQLAGFAAFGNLCIA